MTLPMSSGNTERQIQFMEDLGSTILCCTPSYAASLGESINEGGHRENIKLKAGIFGAEPWTEEMRHNIEESLGIKAYDIYGPRFPVRAYPLNVKSRKECIYRKITSFLRLLIQIQEKFFQKEKSES